MILPIVLYGNSILREKAKKVPLKANINQLVFDMLETMHAANGVGLAAPQVNQCLRLFVVDISTHSDCVDIENNAKMVMINPIVRLDHKEETSLYSEGCLSIPSVMIDVPRKENITVAYFDELWQKKKIQLKGFAARVVLHEYDHLNGVLHIDYASKKVLKSFEKNLADIKTCKVSTEYKILKHC